MFVEGKTRKMDNMHGVIGLDMQYFYDTLLENFNTYN